MVGCSVRHWCVQQIQKPLSPCFPGLTSWYGWTRDINQFMAPDKVLHATSGIIIFITITKIRGGKSNTACLRALTLLLNEKQIGVSFHHVRALWR